MPVPPRIKPAACAEHMDMGMVGQGIQFFLVTVDHGVELAWTGEYHMVIMFTPFTPVLQLRIWLAAFACLAPGGYFSRYPG